MTITYRLTKGSALTFAEADANFAEIATRVVGPGSSVDGRIALFDGTTGYLIKDGGTTLSSINSSISSLNTSVTNLNSNALTSSSTITDFVSGIIQTPADGSYKIVVNSPIAMTITALTTICVSGTCTLTGKINTTALGGSTNSVSSSEVTQTHGSSNSLAVGDDLVLTVSSNSSCSYLSFTVKFTRTLA